MSIDNLHKANICPLCGKEYSRPPALSRKDNKTLICPECGTRESLLVLHLPEEKIEAILHQIRKTEEEMQPNSNS